MVEDKGKENKPVADTIDLTDDDVSVSANEPNSAAVSVTPLKKKLKTIRETALRAEESAKPALAAASPSTSQASA